MAQELLIRSRRVVSSNPRPKRMVYNNPINDNVVSNLHHAEGKLAGTVVKLSSGSRILNPQDDAAGLAIIAKTEVELAKNRAIRANQANMISYSQVQDGMLDLAGKALARMSELSMLYKDQTKSSADRDLYKQEFHQLLSQIAVQEESKLNGVPLFGDLSNNKVTGVDGKFVDLEKIVYPHLQDKITQTVTENYPITTTTELSRAPLSVSDIHSGSNSQVMTCELSGSVGTLEYRWQHYGAADKVEMFYEGQKIFHTGSNPLSGEAEQVPYTGSTSIPINGTSTSLQIIVNDGILSNGSVWEVWFDGGLDVTPKTIEETSLGTRSYEVTTYNDLLQIEDLAGVQATNSGVSEARGSVGANMGRLESELHQATVLGINTTEALGRIKDVDLADEMQNIAKYQILTQGSTGLLHESHRIGGKSIYNLLDSFNDR